MLSGGMLTRSVIEQRASYASVDLVRVFHLSESGIDVAIQALRADPTYVGTRYTDLGHHVGGYAIEVIPDGPSRRTIRSAGFYPSNNPTAPGYAMRILEAVVEITKGIGPGYGVLGAHSVRLEGLSDGRKDEGINVDSYDSRQGTASANVRVCTDNNERGSITLRGSVAIMGDVLLGPGSDPEDTLQRVLEEWTSISGSVSVADVGAPLEPVEMPMLPDGGRLSVSGHEVVTLPGGLYRFRAIDISGHGKLVFTGPAEVYVDDGVQISGKGQIDTAAQLPTNLAFYVKGSRVLFDGDADLFAKVNAPYATVEISGNGDLYGAVTGREVVVRGHTDIHYDEATNIYDEALNPPRSSDLFRASVLSWREVGGP